MSEKVSLHGQVNDGLGESHHYLSLPGYLTQFRAYLGYTPFPGTLNLELTKESVRSQFELESTTSILINKWEDSDRSYGSVVCYPVTIETVGECYKTAHLIQPDRTDHDEQQLEIIAPDKLRNELNLENGELITVHIGGTQ